MGTQNLPKGVRYNKGSYEARKVVNGVSICMHNKDLNVLLEEFESAIKAAMNNVDYRIKHITLDEWFDEWFETIKKHDLKETSIPVRKRLYKRTFGFFIGKHLVSELMPMDIQKAINAMITAEIATSSIMDAKGMLHECLDAAIGNRLLPTNPCLGVVVPKEYKGTAEEIFLLEDEEELFLKDMENSWYSELFQFMFLTGVRVGELGGLMWSDIDFKNEMIHIKQSLSCNYGDGEKNMGIVPPKTACSVRDIPFMGNMREILLAQKDKVDALKRRLGKRWRAVDMPDLVFVTSMGSPCTRYIVAKEINKAVKRINEEAAIIAIQNNQTPAEAIRKFHPHSIRHTFATRCAESGMDMKVAQLLLGHSNISITLTVYTHVSQKKMLAETAKLFRKNVDGQDESTPTAEVVTPITAKSHF
ncbi:MAG: site-specific integrase [Lachnospiraceae bacterium]|nr:site-specific integrase [Lachnospiraceae bacterium]MBP3593963.1 site-specific integrase [Lachnospiraceae bacterium]